MPPRKRPPQNKAKGSVPDWAKKVKTYREEARRTQIDIQKAMKTAVNTMSLVETGRRMFTPTERIRFFELVGKSEDTSIPVQARVAKTPTPKKTARLAKPAQMSASQNVQSAIIGASKTVKTRKDSNAVPVVSPTPPTTKALAPKPAGVSVANVALKPIRKPRIPKSSAQTATTSTPALPTPPKSGERVPIPATWSPVKDAVLRDVSRILGNPALSDTQAKRMHGLFLSLAVNAMGE